MIVCLHFMYCIFCSQNAANIIDTSANNIPHRYEELQFSEGVIIYSQILNKWIDNIVCIHFLNRINLLTHLKVAQSLDMRCLCTMKR